MLITSFLGSMCSGCWSPRTSCALLKVHSAARQKRLKGIKRSWTLQPSAEINCPRIGDCPGNFHILMKISTASESSSPTSGSCCASLTDCVIAAISARTTSTSPPYFPRARTSAASALPPPSPFHSSHRGESGSHACAGTQKIHSPEDSHTKDDVSGMQRSCRELEGRDYRDWPLVNTSSLHWQGGSAKGSKERPQKDIALPENPIGRN